MSSPPPSGNPSFDLSTALPPLTVGFVLGMGAGYLFRILGRMVLLWVGLIFVGVQLLASYGIVNVDWLKLQAVADPWLAHSGQSLQHWFSTTLTHDLPFAGSFAAGFWFGLRRL